MQQIPEGSTGGVATAGRVPPVTGGVPAGLAGLRRDGLRLPWALLVAVAGGLALAAAFPPAGFWPLAAAGPALLVIALWRQRLRTAVLAGLIFGLTFFFPL